MTAEDPIDLSRLDMEPSGSLAALFMAASQQLAQSDARIYRSVDRHLRRTRELLAQEDSPEWRQPDLKPPREIIATFHLLQGAPSYERQPRKALELLCKEHEIRGYSRMSKALMITHLKAKGVNAPPVPLQAFSKAELLALIEHLTTNQGDDHES